MEFRIKGLGQETFAHHRWQGIIKELGQETFAHHRWRGILSHLFKLGPMKTSSERMVLAGKTLRVVL